VRRFHSYGPVDERRHFTVPRKELVDSCLKDLVGDPEEGGHYFTVWGPRQTGKTWLVHRVKREIEARYGDAFAVHCASLGRTRGMRYERQERSEELSLPQGLADVLEDELPGSPRLSTWKDFYRLFSKEHGRWDRPLILFIDEADTTPPLLLDLMVNQFREMYLKREGNRLHGLALAGVHAVLGAESERGSPFNIQRSLRVPNLTRGEVEDLYRQYQEESGQAVDPAVVEGVYEATRGQPGLVSWLGELLTEKYNPGREKKIGIRLWEEVYQAALTKEWSNNVLNLIKKARGPYSDYVLELFVKSDLPFSVRADWCGYLHLNGIVDETEMEGPDGKKARVCRFSSPFVQKCLYDAFTMDWVGDRLPILALDPLDTLADVFDKPELDVPALLQRYKGYLRRLKTEGVDPWKDQPRRADLRLTEYVGHFHLYFWLQNAVGRRCAVAPEFPTGNGRVDLHLRCKGKQGIVEVKSFRDRADLEDSKGQAARYARKLNLSAISLAVFVPVEDESVLEALSSREVLDGIEVTVTAVGWA